MAFAPTRNRLIRLPMQEKAHDFPNAIEAFFLVLALFMIEYLLGGLLWDWNAALGLAWPEISVIVTVLANGAVFTAVTQLKHLSYRNLFHATPMPYGKLFTHLLIPILLLLPALLLGMGAINYVLMELFPLSRDEEEMFAQMTDSSLAMLIAACVLAPLLEEMLFRGVILRGFLQQYSRWPAIIGSALLFGLAHMNIYQFAVATILGLLLGWLYERTQSLLPCITLHAAYNSMVSLAQLSTPDTRENVSVIWWIMAALLAATGMHYLHKMLDKLKA